MPKAIASSTYFAQSSNLFDNQALGKTQERDVRSISGRNAQRRHLKEEVTSIKYSRCLQVKAVISAHRSLKNYRTRQHEAFGRTCPSRLCHCPSCAQCTAQEVINRRRRERLLRIRYHRLDTYWASKHYLQ
jgi:hypothetical protein